MQIVMIGEVESQDTIGHHLVPGPSRLHTVPLLDTLETFPVIRAFISTSSRRVTGGRLS